MSRSSTIDWLGAVGAVGSRAGLGLGWQADGWIVVSKCFLDDAPGANFLGNNALGTPTIPLVLAMSNMNALLRGAREEIQAKEERDMRN